MQRFTVTIFLAGLVSFTPSFAVLQTADAQTGSESADLPASRTEAFQWLRRARTALVLNHDNEAQPLIVGVIQYGQEKGDDLVFAWGYLLSGEQTFAAGNYRSAVTAYELSLELFSKLKDRQGQTTAQINLGRLHRMLGESAKAIDVLQKAKQAIVEKSQPLQFAGICTDLAECYLELNEPEKAVALFNQALVVYRESKQSSNDGMFRVLLGLARVSLMKNNLESAGTHLDEAGRLVGRSQSPQRTAELHHLRGLVLQQRGELAEARKEYEAALELFTAHELQASSERAAILNNLGVLDQSQGNMDEALKAFEQALQLSREQKDPGSQSRALYNIAAILESQGSASKAIEHYEQALALRRQLDDKAGIIAVLDNLALLYALENQTQKAEAAWSEADQLRKKK